MCYWPCGHGCERRFRIGLGGWLVLLLGALLGAACPSLAATLAPEVDMQALMTKLGVPLAVTERPPWPASPGSSVAVTLIPQVEAPGAYMVSFGLPFGPGWLADDLLIRVTDEGGRELSTFTRPLARWWGDPEHSSLRSVLVQFEVSFATRSPRTVVVTWDRPRTARRRLATPIADTQVVLDQKPWDDSGRYLAFQYHCPRVLVVLPADWLCASLLAWQQVPARQNTIAPWFDEDLEASFADSLPNMSAADYSAHLFDRPATYFKLYVRSGEERHLLAGLRTVEFYLQHLREDGFFDLKPDPDVKYVFTEGFALAYLLTGDERYREGITRALKAWATHQRIEYQGEGFWTERHHGFGMLAYLHAYEVSGDPLLLANARRYFEAVWSLQTRPLHGGEPDGAWLHTSESHSERPGAWVTSPWMSAFLADAIWKYWMLSGDSRAPVSLAMYATFTLRHSLSEDGKSLLYLASSPGLGEGRPESGASHNMEGCYLLAMGHYLTQGREPRCLEAIEGLRMPMTGEDANSPTRKFTWRFRETSMLVWFLQQAGSRGDSSLAGQAPPHEAQESE
jgi:hypothetical protein